MVLPRKILAAFVTTVIAATGLVATVGVPPASATPGLPPPVQVNTDATGAPQPGISDFAVSGNGRYVTFNGNSDWLSPGCPAGTPGCGTRMYVKDLVSGAVAPVGDGDNGQYPNSNGYASAMDNTGRYVAFISNAHNLVPVSAGDPVWSQVYVRDRDVDGDGIYDEPGQTSLTMLSRQWTPTTGQGPAQPYGAEIYGLAMSADGRYVSYTSPGATGADVHVVDRDVDNDGIFDEPDATDNRIVATVPGVTHLQISDMTPDGRYLVVGPHDGGSPQVVIDRDSDANGVYDETGTVSQTTLDPGIQAVSISADGRKLLVETSQSFNPADAAPTGSGDGYVYDRDADGNGVFDETGAGRTSYTLVTQRADGTVPSSDNVQRVAEGMSGDGRYVLFASQAVDPATSDVVGDGYTADDTNGVDDYFLRDTSTNTVSRLSDVCTSCSAVISNLAARVGRPARLEGGNAVFRMDKVSDSDTYAQPIRGVASALNASLSLSTHSTSPGATTVPLSAVPADQLRAIATNVSAASRVRRSPLVTKASRVRRSPLARQASLVRRSSRVRRSPLSSVPLTIDGGWAAVLAGTPLEGQPLDSVTLDDVLALMASGTLPADHPLLSLAWGDIDLDNSAFKNISPAGYLLDLAPVDTLGVRTPEGGRADFCTELQIETGVACSNPLMGPVVAGQTTLPELDLNPDARRILDRTSMVSRIELGSNWASFGTSADANANPAYITSLDLHELDTRVSRLGDISIAALAATTPGAALPLSSLGDLTGIVSCSLVDCSTQTLGDALTAGAVAPASRLRDLTQALPAGVTLGAFPAATFDGLVVNDVVVSMLDASDFPWEDMDLDHAGLAQASGNAPRITVSVSVTATGSGPLSGALRLSMASGFTAVPGAARISPAPSGATTDLGAPSVVNGQTVWNLTGIQPGTAYTVNVDVWPGLVLGSQPIRGQLDLGGSTQVFSPQAFTVVAPSDAGATRATATNITRDTLVLGYVSSPGDVDVYHFDSSTIGRAPVQIQLGHQAADSDLVVYGPADPQPSSRTVRAQPGPGVAPTPDVAGDPSDPAQTGDTKLLTGESVTASSANAGLADDAVSAVQPDLIQVAGNEGATSPKPYSLRVRVGLNEPQPACAAYSGNGGVAGSASLAALPTGLDTVFLVNQQRLGDKYGTTRAAAVMAALQQLAGRSDLGVHGAVLSVEGDPAVSSAYAAWNAQPCTVANANGVVDAINGLVDRARSARPTLHNLVLVGADDMVPMARLADTTAANGEKQQAAELDPSSVLAGTLAQNVFLSDDPYATTSPIAYLNRKLYTPDLAIGRLVEKPEEIITALSEFQANSGVLSPDGGLVTGEDVFADGAGAVADTLQSSLSTAKGSPVSIARLDNPIVANGTWSASALQTGLHSAPKVTGLFGHFDQSALVAGDGSLLDVTDAIGTSGLPGGARLVFSMGCHSGLNVPSADNAPVDDWAQGFAGRGAVYIASTGFGYGIPGGIGLHERLFNLLARQLDGAVTVGDALTYAKQTYLATQGLYGSYDEKAVGETVYYGLPMFRLAAVPTVRTNPTAPTTVVTGTGTERADLATINPTFTASSGRDGTYWTANNQDPLSVVGSPVQPRLVVDVSQKTGNALRTVAKGAVITAMTTQSKTANVDPVVASAEVTDPGTDPDPGANSFPSQLQSVTTQAAPDGTRQQLVLVPGRFLASADGTAGTQELMTGLHVSVLYSSGTDYTAPTQQASATITGTTAKFTVQTTGGAGRVAVLWNQANTATWQDAELTDPGATGTFTGSVTLTATGGPLQFSSQAVDPSGNVSVASGKGAGLGSSTPSTYAFATTGPSTPSGWFNGPATLTVTSSQPSVPFDISVDGAAPQPYIGPIVIGAEGTHAVSITGSDGGQATTTVKVDSKLPTVGFATMPPTNTTFNVGAAVPIAYQCADAAPGSGIASCAGPTLPASLDTATPTAPGVPRSVTVIAKDAAGHTVTGTYRYSVVQTVVPGAPVVNAGPDLNYGVGTQRTISASFTDALPGGGPYTYRLDPGDGRGYSLPVAKAKAGAITVKVTYAKVGTFTASLTVCDATGRCGTDRLVLSSRALVRTACVVAPAKATQPWKTTITVTNSNTAAVAVALGTSNVMTNATASPATKFPVGAKTFSYTFTNSAQPLTWTLLGAVLTVRTTGPRC